MFTLGFKDLKVSCIIGCLEYERKNKQTIHLDLSVDIPLPETLNDDITCTLNYSTLANICSQIAQDRSFQLLESLAYEISQVLHRRFSIHAIDLTIKKPHGIPHSDYAFVQLKKVFT